MRFAPLQQILVVALVLILAACSPAGDSSSGGLFVVTTTSILGDVVAQVGGELIDVTVLIPADVDPHSYEPTPRDLAAVADADLVFVNGLDLEGFLDAVIANARADAYVVEVSQDVPAIEFAGEDEHEEEGEAEEHEEGVDPHVWLDPNNVILWTEVIADELAAMNPDNRATYAANGEAYIAELQALDAWALEQVGTLEPSQRILVTDHDALGYFAAHYGFEVVGLVVSGTSALAEPSAGDLAALEAHIADSGAPAIFVGVSVNPDLAEQVAADTGVQLVPIYTGALSGPEGPAANYIELMRYDVRAIVGALGD